MKKIYGYIGHSTDTAIAQKQHRSNQYYGINAIAANNEMGRVQFVMEPESEQVSPPTKELENLLSSRIQSGDVLITDLQALGSSMLEIVDVLSILVQKGVMLFSLDGSGLGWIVEPKVMAFIQSVVAEVQGDVGSTSNEIRKGKEGKVLGRPIGTLGKSKLDGHDGDIKKRLTEGETKSSIALRYNISRPALQDFIESRKLMV